MVAANQAEWARGQVISTRAAAGQIAEIVIAVDRPVRAEPGSHVDVRLPDGDTRSYSVVAADGATVTLGVRRSPTSRGGSRYMHSLVPGDPIDITLPLQNFPFGVGARTYVLLAGGVGITALKAMGEMVRRLGVDYRFIYVGRTRQAMAFVPELVATHGDRFELLVNDEGGVLDAGSLVAGLDDQTELYMCGPIRLMDAVRRAWVTRDLPLPNLRYETFGNSGWFDPEEFVVEVPSMGIEATVSAGESMLDALERAGVDMMFDCRKGECGLCQVDVVSVDGVIDHRDVFLSEKQKDTSNHLCACVSRVAGGCGRRRSTDAPVITLALN
ncbi:PDR/VanB family oxidoreductase [Gordonia sp. CPCC 205515]|uniref:PDR/VanB family oxidoreductase n=1 Tax=Gordonia sp. CPCC 205515 TaxID=3140791 RepID=UPI003AF36044